MFGLTRLAGLCLYIGTTGIAAAQEAPAKRTGDSPGTKYAVVVGVSGYLVPTVPGFGGFSSLQFAHQDAQRVSTWLNGKGWKVTLLQGFPGATATQASKESVLNALSGLQTNSNDTVMFYFSGHGIRVDTADFLAPGDARFKNTAEEGSDPNWRPEKESLISYAELEARFRKLRASKRLIVVDACRDEPKASKDGVVDTRLNQAKLGEVVQASEYGSTSYAVLYSCKPGERSYEASDRQAGIFTSSLLHALDAGEASDADGEVVLEKLNTATRKRVLDWAKQKGYVMSPNMTQSIEEPISLGKLPVKPATAAAGNPAGGPVKFDFLETLGKAEAGETDAMVLLATAYEYGQNGLEWNEPEAAKWYQKLLEANHPRGMSGVGWMMYSGKGGFQRNDVESVKLFRKAVEAGDARAMGCLANFFRLGVGGLPKSEAEVFKWARQGAEYGDPIAQVELGFALANGIGTGRNLLEAAACTKKAANAGSTSGMNDYGLACELGYAGEKDYAEAFRWYQKAAIRDHNQAVGNVGLCYLYGRGTENDDTKAFKYLREAVDKGSEWHGAGLGQCYEKGIGTLKNLEEAIKCYKKSAAAGNSYAKDQLKRLGIEG